MGRSLVKLGRIPRWKFNDMVRATHSYNIATDPRPDKYLNSYQRFHRFMIKLNVAQPPEKTK